MRTIFILMDSLNRHFLSPYNKDAWVKTPNLNRLAARGVTFDNHWAGSLPCMPARREIMTGRHNFLESRWGCLEPYDDAYPRFLSRQAGVYTHMITDHYHYFEPAGEGYNTAFNSWELERGQESDVWKPVVRNLPRPPKMKRGGRAYWANRSQMDLQDDLAYPTPRSFERGCEFLQLNHAEDNWHLQLEVFDPHEPFNCPQKYLDMYQDTWDPSPENQFDWPQYAPVEEDAATVEHVRKCYAGTLTMADHWLGKFLDTMDELDMWKDTMVILTTDHGHLLGEHGYWAKNYMFDYRELTHIPMFVAGAGLPAGERRGALTATVDLMPSLLDLHGLEAPAHCHGKSIKPVLAGAETHHDAVLYGYFGKDVSVTDGKRTYTRQPIPDAPLFHHTANPRVGLEALKQAEIGRGFLPRIPEVPMYRVASTSNRHHNAPAEGHLLFDLETDPWQDTPLQDPALEATYVALLRRKLEEAQAPAEQYARLALN